MSKIKKKKFTNNLNAYNFVFAYYKMSLKFGETKLNLKETLRWKQAIYLNQFEISKTVISDDYKLDDGVKIFIGYKNDKTVKPVSIILLQIMDWLNISKTTKKHVIFSWWWCDFEIQQNFEKD